MSKYIVYDITSILCSSVELKKIVSIKNKDGDNIGLPLVALAIIRDCSIRFREYSPIFVCSGGYSEICKKLYPGYKAYNVYYEESRALSPDSDVDSKKVYDNAIDDLSKYIDLRKIDGIDHEYVIGYITNDNENEYLIVSEDDEFSCFLKDNCKLYRPYENTLVNYSSYMKASEMTHEDFMNIPLIRAIVGNAFDMICGACQGVGDVYAPELLKLLELNNFDLSEFNDGKKDLRKFCEDNGIKYRSAYKNFDLGKFRLLSVIYDYRNSRFHIRSQDDISKIDSWRDDKINGDDMMSSLNEDKFRSINRIGFNQFTDYVVQYRYSC